MFSYDIIPKKDGWDDDGTVITHQCCYQCSLMQDVPLKYSKCCADGKDIPRPYDKAQVDCPLKRKSSKRYLQSQLEILKVLTSDIQNADKVIDSVILRLNQLEGDSSKDEEILSEVLNMGSPVSEKCKKELAEALSIESDGKNDCMFCDDCRSLYPDMQCLLNESEDCEHYNNFLEGWMQAEGAVQ